MFYNSRLTTSYNSRTIGFYVIIAAALYSQAAGYFDTEAFRVVISNVAW